MHAPRVPGLFASVSDVKVARSQGLRPVLVLPASSKGSCLSLPVFASSQGYVVPIVFLSCALANRPRLHKCKRRQMPSALCAMVATSQSVMTAEEVAQALSVACRDGKVKDAMAIMEEYPGQVRDSLRQPPADGKLSALSWACNLNLSGVVKQMLLRYQDELRDGMDQGFFIACRSGHCEIVEAMLDSFPREASRGAGRNFLEACRQGQSRVVTMLLKTFPAEAQRVVGRALHEACHRGHSSIARKLLDEFAEECRYSLEKSNMHGDTPLHGACKNGLLRIVRHFLEHFPAESRLVLELKDYSGRTPVIWAIENKHEAVVELLIKHFPTSVAQAPSLELEDASDLPEMLKDKSRGDLEHAGYRLVGSHSAVKQCRWTKNALYGQGQCYKHTFYGINSHQCMEATPSLACANKCVFCWRNHMNPVATSWDFKTDDPDFVVRESVKNHLELIDEAASSPLALPERILEARTPRHTALSLVGEPVLYPERARYIAALHERRISTFLVTNGQFPDELKALPWVTQLYVSLDAPDAASLKEVGRPLFRDYWQRLRQALTVLREKDRQRTVCRLTVLRGECTTDEACEGYAELVRLAEAGFVEVKGGTFAPIWKKTRSGLDTGSVPSHDEVKDFAKRLAARLPGYGLACEHEHSCGVLLARRDLYFDPWGRWHTWIDYDRFADAACSGEVLDVREFAAETPDWALAANSDEKASPELSSCRTPSRIGDGGVGFDPSEQRRFRKPLQLEEQSETEMPRYYMMCDVAVISPGGDDIDTQKCADILLQRKDVRTIAVFEPRGSGLAPDRNGVRFVAGDPNLEITYKENGLRFRLDLARRLSRLAKSQGSCDERRRICSLVQPHERILVLGSGIGLTTCLLGAKTACKEVVGIDRDPVAHEFALANIELNELGGRVQSVLGDPYEQIEMGGFDRVCAFLTFTRDGKPQTLAGNMAPAVRALAPGGTLHIYDHQTQQEFDSGADKVNQAMADACGDRRFELTWRDKVPHKSIGRNWFRVGLDFRLDCLG